MARGDGVLALPALIGQLIDDLRNMAQAEIQLVKARGYAFVRRSRSAVVLLVIALLAVQGAVTALMVGIVLQLAALVGGAAAGAIVMVVMLLIAGLLAWAAVRAFTGPADTKSAAEKVT